MPANKRIEWKLGCLLAIVKRGERRVSYTGTFVDKMTSSLCCRPRPYTTIEFEPSATVGAYVVKVNNKLAFAVVICDESSS